MTRRFLCLAALLGAAPLAAAPPQAPPGGELVPFQVTSDPDIIPYRRLSWADFRVDDRARALGAAFADGEAGAQTECAWTLTRLVARVRKQGERWQASMVEVGVKSGFKRAGTWRRSQLPDPDGVLAHEQIHLDVNEIRATHFRRLPPAAFPGGSGGTEQAALDDFAARFKQFFNAQAEEATRIQHRYDRETENGQARVKQDEWSRATQQALKQLGIR